MELECQRQAQADRALSQTVRRFSEQPFERYRPRELEAVDPAVFPNLLNRLPFAARQFDCEVFAVGQLMEGPHLDAIARHVTDHAQVLARARNQLGGADQQREARGVALLERGLALVPGARRGPLTVVAA